MKKIFGLVILAAVIGFAGCGKNPCLEYGNKVNVCMKDLCKGKDKCMMCQAILNPPKTDPSAEVKCEGETKKQAETALKNFKNCDSLEAMAAMKKGMEAVEGCK